MTAAARKGEQQHISINQFYEAQLATNQAISDLELRLTAKIEEIKGCVPSPTEWRNLNERVSEVDRKNNLYAGITTVVGLVAATVAGWFGSR